MQRKNSWYSLVRKQWKEANVAPALKRHLQVAIDSSLNFILCTNFKQIKETAIFAELCRTRKTTRLLNLFIYFLTYLLYILIYLFIYLFTCLLAYSLTHLHVYLFTYLRTHFLSYSLIYLLIPLDTYSPTYLLSCLLIPLVHPLTATDLLRCSFP